MSATPEPEKKKIRAYHQSHLEIVLRVRQFFEQERKKHCRINLNNVLQRTTAPIGVNRNIIGKIQAREDVLKWKKKPGVPVCTPSDPVIPTNFFYYSTSCP